MSTSLSTQINIFFALISFIGVTFLAGCTPPPPSGPTIAAMPHRGEALATFQADDYACQNYAQETIGSPEAQQQTETNNVVESTIIGTTAGAAVGALLGSAGGNAGTGAAIGAGAGLLGGAAVGSNNEAATGMSAQRRYNVAYAQCMTSKGYKIQSGYTAPAGDLAGPPPGYVEPPPYPYNYPYYTVPLGFIPLFIAGPGWYHGHWYPRRGYYGPGGRFMPGYHPH